MGKEVGDDDKDLGREDVCVRIILQQVANPLWSPIPLNCQQILALFLSICMDHIFEQIIFYGSAQMIRVRFCLCLSENWSPINRRVFAAFRASFRPFFLQISHSLWPSDASKLPPAKPTVRILSRWIRVNLENFPLD